MGTLSTFEICHSPKIIIGLKFCSTPIFVVVIWRYNSGGGGGGGLLC